MGLEPCDRPDENLFVLKKIRLCLACSCCEYVLNAIPLINVSLYLGYSKEDIVTLGITNQRETTIAWDKYTGEPLHPAIGNNISVSSIHTTHHILAL